MSSGRYAGPMQLSPHAPRLWPGLREGSTLVDGTRIHHVEAGEGPTVILLHGALFSGSDTWWGTQLALAERGYRTIAPDWPGWGSSDKPVHAYTVAFYLHHLLGWVHALGLQGAPVVGHSMGGLMASTFAIHHPELLGPLATIAVPPSWVACPVPSFFKPFMIPGMGELMMAGLPWAGARGPLGIRKALLSLMHDPRALGEERLTAICEHNCIATAEWGMVRAFLSTLRRNRDLFEGDRAEYRGMAQAYPQPYWALAGAQDPLFKPSFIEQGASLLPQGQATVLEACGHFPMWERPEATVDWLGAFLQLAVSGRPLAGTPS